MEQEEQIAEPHRDNRDMDAQKRLSIPMVYYAVTPAFILLDYFGGLNIRVAILDSYPTYKGLYYFFCILCGVCIYLVPRFSPIVALFESFTIIMMTILALYIPYFITIEDVMNADFDFTKILTIPYIVNLILAGGIAAFTFNKSLEAFGISDNKIKDKRNDSNSKPQNFMSQD